MSTNVPSKKCPQLRDPFLGFLVVSVQSTTSHNPCHLYNGDRSQEHGVCCNLRIVAFFETHSKVD